MPPTLRSPDLHFRLEAFTSFPPSRPVRFASRVDIRPMPAFVSTRPNQTGHHSRPTLSCSFLLTRIQLDWCALPSANQNRSSGVLRLSRRANLRHTHRLGHAAYATLARSSFPLRSIHVIPAIAACPVRLKSGHSANARVRKYAS